MTFPSERFPKYFEPDLMKTPRIFVALLTTVLTVAFFYMRSCGPVESEMEAVAYTAYEPADEGLAEGSVTEDANDLEALNIEEMIDYPASAVPGELLIRFDRREDYAAYLQALEAAGYFALGRIDALMTARVPSRTVSSVNPAAFNADAEFSYRVRQPPLPVDIAPAALAALRGFETSAREITGGGPGAGNGAGVVVAILDSGIGLHPQLEEVEIVDFDLSGEGISGPGSDHGTAVASIVAGSEGVAPEAELMVMRVLDADGEGSSFTVAQGLVEAVDRGAQIINMSLGVYQDTPVLREAVQYAASRGVLMVAAAGNDAVDVLPFPAAYDEVLAVTAVDALGQQALFPNQSMQIDFAAPGVGVLTAEGADGVSSFSGTSAAAPFVTGTLAALMSGNARMTPQGAVNFLQSYANEAGAPGDDPRFGGGVLDWERMRRHGERGVVDVALASIYIPQDSLPGTRAAVDVVVENRGTQWLNGAQLEVQVAGESPKAFPISSLTVGETTTRRIYADVPASETESLQVRARVMPKESDVDIRDENNMTGVRFRPLPAQ